jgi:hypothetical protein
MTKLEHDDMPDPADSVDEALRKKRLTLDDLENEDFEDDDLDQE